MLTTVRPRNVGSFFISRSSERAKLRAVASRPSTSSRETSAIESRCRRSAGAGGSRSSRITRMSPMDLLLWRRDEQHLVDLVHLDELHLDALLPRGRQALARLVRPDWNLAVPPVRQAGELDARGAPVVEKRVDRRADRSARVQHVVDEDDRATFEREVKPCGAHERLRMPRGGARRAR